MKANRIHWLCASALAVAIVSSTVPAHADDPGAGTASWNHNGGGIWTDDDKWDTLPQGCYPDAGECGVAWCAAVGGTPLGDIDVLLDVELLALLLTGGNIQVHTPFTLEIDELDWQGGALTGTGSVSVFDSIDITNTVDLRTLLFNHGVTTLDGEIEADSGGSNVAVITNIGEFILMTDADMTGTNTPLPLFINDGVLRKLGAGLGRCALVLESSGEIRADEGTLKLDNDSTISGDVIIDFGATLELEGPSGNVYVFDALSNVTGGGTAVLTGSLTFSSDGVWDVDTTVIDSGSIDFANASMRNLELNGGDVSGTVFVDENLLWNGGDFEAGTLFVIAGGTIDGGSLGGELRLLDLPSVSVNPNVVTVTGTLNGQNGADISIDFDSTLILDGGNVMVPTGQSGFMLNEGTVVKLGAGLRTIAFDTENRGIIAVDEETLRFTKEFVQLDGEIDLRNGSTIRGNNPFAVLGGRITGDGVIDTDVELSGCIAPGGSGRPGTIAFNSGHDLIVLPGGVLEFDLGSSVQGSDSISVAQFAELDGFLEVSLLPGFTPAESDVFTVLDAFDLTGEFANVVSGGDLLTADRRGVFTVYYGPGSPFDEDTVVVTGYRLVDCLPPGRIYWTHPSGLTPRNLNGFPWTGSSLVSFDPYRGVAIDVESDLLFYTQPPFITRRHGLAFDFASGTDYTISMPPQPEDVVVGRTTSGAFIFWTDPGAGEVLRADLDGANVTTIVAGLIDPAGIAFDTNGERVYWTDRGTGTVQRANIDGDEKTDVLDFADGLVDPCGIAIDPTDGSLYISDISAGSARVLHWNPALGAPVVIINDLGTVAGVDDPFDLAIDEVQSHLYWTDEAGGIIWRADLSGANVLAVFTGLTAPRRIAVDPHVKDCNGNGIDDACDIASGTSDDLDGDGIPDECPKPPRMPSPRVLPGP